MASLTWRTWVWASFRSWWWTGKPGVLQFIGSQRVGHDWVTELNWRFCHSDITPIDILRTRFPYFSLCIRVCVYIYIYIYIKIRDLNCYFIMDWTLYFWMLESRTHCFVMLISVSKAAVITLLTLFLPGQGRQWSCYWNRT